MTYVDGVGKKNIMHQYFLSPATKVKVDKVDI
jgi:hypothetical protein